MELLRYCLICGEPFKTTECRRTCSKPCQDECHRQDEQYVEWLLSSSVPKALAMLGLQSIEEYVAWKAERSVGKVYFIQAENDVDAPIKIGFSKDVQARLRELQTATHTKLCVLATTDGSIEDEAEIHARFANERILGEWFEASAGLRNYVARL